MCFDSAILKMVELPPRPTRYFDEDEIGMDALSEGWSAPARWVAPDVEEIPASLTCYFSRAQAYANVSRLNPTSGTAIWRWYQRHTDPAGRLPVRHTNFQHERRYSVSQSLDLNTATEKELIGIRG